MPRHGHRVCDKDNCIHLNRIDHPSNIIHTFALTITWMIINTYYIALKATKTTNLGIRLVMT